MTQIDSQSLLYDAPLHDPSQDRLGRAEFAKFLAKAILKMDAAEGFVFALNGPWGSGKTTIINFVLHFIEKEQKEPEQLIEIRFNPWWFSGREQLLQQFFRQIQAALGARDVPKDLKEIGKKLSVFAHILEPIGLLPMVGGWTSRIKDWIRISSAAAKTFAEALEKDVHKIRGEIDSMLKKQKSRILVVIDDIDRLPTEEIRQIFQLVKAVADFPKTIYLLSFDRKVVLNALSQLQGGSGEEYLEKIVQAPFDLPVPDRTSLQRLLFEQLDEILSGTPEGIWDFTEWGNIYWDGIDLFIETPRDIKRFVNILRAAYPIVKGEVNPADFMGIQALRVFASEIYYFIGSNKEQICGVENNSGYRPKPEERRKVFDNILETVPEPKRKAVKEIMSRLFPRFSSAYGGMSYGSSWLSNWRKKLRICSPDVFDRFFMLSIPPGHISSAEMRGILNQANDPETFGAELIRLAGEKRPNGTTRLRIFLERMEDFTERDIPDEQIEPILRTIYDMGDKIPAEEDTMGMFDYGNDMRLLRISYQLIKRLPTQQKRFQLLKNIFADAKSLSLVIHDIVTMGQEHGRGTQREPSVSQDERTISLDQVIELEALGLKKIREAIGEKRLHLGPKFGHLLYRLSDWGSEEEAKEYALNLIKDDEGFCHFLAGFLSVSHSQGIDDRVSKRTWRIHVASIEKFISSKADTLLNRCERILKESPNWLGGHKRLALETFLQEIRQPKDEWGRPKRE